MVPGYVDSLAVARSNAWAIGPLSLVVLASIHKGVIRKSTIHSGNDRELSRIWKDTPGATHEAKVVAQTVPVDISDALVRHACGLVQWWQAVSRRHNNYKFRPARRAQKPTCSLQRALLTLTVNPGSLYRCSKRT